MKSLCFLIALSLISPALAADIDPYVYIISGAELGVPEVRHFVIIPDEYETQHNFDNPELTRQLTLDGVIPAIEIDRYGDVIEPID